MKFQILKTTKNSYKYLIFYLNLTFSKIKSHIKVKKTRNLYQILTYFKTDTDIGTKYFFFEFLFNNYTLL